MTSARAYWLATGAARARIRPAGLVLGRGADRPAGQAQVGPGFGPERERGAVDPEQLARAVP